MAAFTAELSDAPSNYTVLEVFLSVDHGYIGVRHHSVRILNRDGFTTGETFHYSSVDGFGSPSTGQYMITFSGATMTVNGRASINKVIGYK